MLLTKYRMDYIFKKLRHLTKAKSPTYQTIFDIFTGRVTDQMPQDAIHRQCTIEQHLFSGITCSARCRSNLKREKLTTNIIWPHYQPYVRISIGVGNREGDIVIMILY